MLEVSTELEKYLLNTEITKENVVDAAVEIRAMLADSLQKYLGEDFRHAERIIRNGR